MTQTDFRHWLLLLSIAVLLATAGCAHRTTCSTLAPLPQIAPS